MSDPVATSLLGIKFLEMGRDPAVGLDCVGVVLEYFRRRDGREIKCPLSYRTEDFDNEFFRDQFVQIEQPIDGCVAHMGERHLGIRVGRMILHADNTLGVVIQRIAPDAIKGWYVPR
jgi:hypothetical protein